MDKLSPSDIFGDFENDSFWKNALNKIEIDELNNYHEIFKITNFKNDTIEKRQGYLAAFLIYQIVSKFKDVNNLLFPFMDENEINNSKFIIKSANLMAFSFYGIISFGAHCKLEHVDEYMITSHRFFFKMITGFWSNYVDPKCLDQIFELSKKFRIYIKDCDNEKKLSQIFLMTPMISQNLELYNMSLKLIEKYFEKFEKDLLEEYEKAII
jgi:hypothetical protein